MGIGTIMLTMVGIKVDRGGSDQRKRVKEQKMGQNEVDN
jgi:hypothetical protein